VKGGSLPVKQRNTVTTAAKWKDVTWGKHLYVFNSTGLGNSMKCSNQPTESEQTFDIMQN